ncbi:hypothetical protein M433DRAFT_143979 [Acidomyces richmondensis BFW]|nr:MAG: hypothetical protein FE78DRAFT_80097 [Acidomyces sp. 'richmondensis']KYG45428.1 hypothetical protein M433DRAFT_143979 [Acidomyces richmondensis BFW]
MKRIRRPAADASTPKTGAGPWLLAAPLCLAHPSTPSAAGCLRRAKGQRLRVPTTFASGAVSYAAPGRGNLTSSNSPKRA